MTPCWFLIATVPQNLVSYNKSDLLSNSSGGQRFKTILQNKKNQSIGRAAFLSGSGSRGGFFQFSL
jgi:hypothetical protein